MTLQDWLWDFLVGSTNSQPFSVGKPQLSHAKGLISKIAEGRRSLWFVQLQDWSPARGVGFGVIKMQERGRVWSHCCCSAEESQAASWTFYSKIWFIFNFRKRVVGSVDGWSILAVEFWVNPWKFIYLKHGGTSVCSLQQRLIKAKYYKWPLEISLFDFLSNDPSACGVFTTVLKSFRQCWKDQPGVNLVFSQLQRFSALSDILNK